jgi:hypothetical protein
MEIYNRTHYCFACGLVVCTSRERPGPDRAGLLDAGRRSAAEEKESGSGQRRLVAVGRHTGGVGEAGGLDT